MRETPLAARLRRLIEANGPMSVADYMAHCLGDPEHGYYTTRDPLGAAGDFVTAPEVSQLFGEIVGAWLVHTWRLNGLVPPPSLAAGEGDHAQHGGGGESSSACGRHPPPPPRCPKSGVPDFGRHDEQPGNIRVAAVPLPRSAGEEPGGCPLGAPALPTRLVELGPGRGTLMADILRVAAKSPGFSDALTLHLVETSPALRAKQAETLAGYDISWHSSFADIPGGPLLLVANEFFDALPVRQFVRAEGVWRERVVGLDAGRLALGIGPGALAGAPDAPDGSMFELRPAAEALIAEIARRIVEQGGAALVIDYGHAETAPGDTLQAVRGHRTADPLAAPGEADLTAHVDFAALARAARAEGAEVHGPIPQGEFLLRLGLLERAGQLGATADETTRETLHAAVGRLAGPDQMGTLFKVLAVTRKGVEPPPFP